MVQGVHVSDFATENTSADHKKTRSVQINTAHHVTVKTLSLQTVSVLGQNMDKSHKT